MTTSTDHKRLVMTAEAARYLGLSMKRVRALAREKVIWSTKLGPTNNGYDIEDLKRYKSERSRLRRAGKIRGVAPQGEEHTIKSLIVSPENRRLVLTREAAKVLGCSMKHLRHLAREQKLWTTKLGRAAEAYDLDEVERYRDKMSQARADGTAKGRRPQGFKPDPQQG